MKQGILAIREVILTKGTNRSKKIDKRTKLDSPIRTIINAATANFLLGSYAEEAVC